MFKGPAGLRAKIKTLSDLLLCLLDIVVGFSAKVGRRTLSPAQCHTLSPGPHISEFMIAVHAAPLDLALGIN